MSEFRLEPRPALAGEIAYGRHGRQDGAAGIMIRDRPDVAIALVMAGRDSGDASGKIGSALGAALPQSPGANVRSDQTILWSGPDSWLVIRDRQGGAGDALCDELGRSVGDAGAVVDLTDSRTLVLVSGPEIMAFFEKGIAVDLHPRNFRVGDTAICALSQVSVQIWKIDEQTFGLLMPRATAAYIWHWIESASAEFGLELVRA